MKQYLYIALCLLLAACSKQPEIALTVSRCAPMPDGGRASACACVLDGKAYIFAGRDTAGTYRNDLWQYDSQTDTWNNLGATPLIARVNATMVAAGGKIYAGLGYSKQKAYNDKGYQRDWWEYTPATGEWKQLAQYPTANTVAATSYVADGAIYTLFGFGYGYTKDVYRYDIAADTWTNIEITQPRAWLNFGGRGAMCNGRLYFGLGYRMDNLTQWYEVDLPTDTWQQRCSLPGKGRELAACAADNDHVYVFGGRHFAGEMTGGEIFDTYLRYAPEKDSWEWCGQMPCGRAENQVAFCINGKVYFGLGEDENGQVLNCLYRVEK